MTRFVRRLIVRLAVVGVLVVAVMVVANRVTLPGWPFGAERTDRTHTPVLREIVDLQQFQAAEGTFQVVVDVEDGMENVPSLLVGERATMMATGTVAAVVDLGGLTGDAVSVDGDRVTVRLPAPTLTGASIDHDLTEVTSRQRGVLTRLGSALGDDTGDDSALYRVAAARIEAAAVGSDLVVRGKASTRETVAGLLTGLGFDDVTIVFADAAT